MLSSLQAAPIKTMPTPSPLVRTMSAQSSRKRAVAELEDPIEDALIATISREDMGGIL